MSEEPSLLLDTCAIIFIANSSPISADALSRISDAAYDGRLFLSPISAWEIGFAMAKGRLKLPLGPQAFWDSFVERMEARLSELSPSVLIESSHLPGELHGDPMDRILIATARSSNMVLVTRDRLILAYGQANYLRTLAC